MTKSICLFNHKGGVSKTTTAFNIGWALADKGKKVLLVDLDSQCNLTGLVLGYGAIDDDDMAAFYSSRSNLTMGPIVDALINDHETNRGAVITFTLLHRRRRKGNHCPRNYIQMVLVTIVIRRATR